MTYCNKTQVLQVFAGIVHSSTSCQVVDIDFDEYWEDGDIEERSVHEKYGIQSYPGHFFDAMVVKELTECPFCPPNSGETSVCIFFFFIFVLANEKLKLTEYLSHTGFK